MTRLAGTPGRTLSQPSREEIASLEREFREMGRAI
jgi:hypothetical protein